MKLTEAEKAQIQAQRAKVAAASKKLQAAREQLAALPDETALEVAGQLTRRDAYFRERDACGCLKRRDELCRACQKVFDQWFFGRGV